TLPAGSPPTPSTEAVASMTLPTLLQAPFCSTATWPAAPAAHTLPAPSVHSASTLKDGVNGGCAAPQAPPLSLMGARPLANHTVELAPAAPRTPVTAFAYVTLAGWPAGDQACPSQRKSAPSVPLTHASEGDAAHTPVRRSSTPLATGANVWPF